MLRICRYRKKNPTASPRKESRRLAIDDRKSLSIFCAKKREKVCRVVHESGGYTDKEEEEEEEGKDRKIVTNRSLSISDLHSFTSGFPAPKKRGPLPISTGMTGPQLIEKRN